MPLDLPPEMPVSSSPASVGVEALPAPRADRPDVLQTWHINLRLLLVTAVVVAVVAPSLFLWYRFQVSRNAAAILDRARALYEKKDWRTASATFHKYLNLRPDDPEARLLRAQAFDKLAVEYEQKQQAISLYYQALLANPDRHDARLRLAELLFETRRYEDAAKEARTVAQADRQDVAAARQVVAALRAQLGPGSRVKLTTVIDEFEQALRSHPGDVALTLGLAVLLRGNRDNLPGERRDTANSDADGFVDRMVAENPADPAALLGRFRYRTAYKIAGAEDDLNKARELAPDNLDVLRVSADAAATSDWPAARKFGERLLELAPDDRGSYLLLASLFNRHNLPYEAIKTLQSGLKKLGEGTLELNLNLLQFFLQLGQAAEARATLARIDPVVRRLGPYLAVPSRRRLEEDVEVAGAQLALIEGDGAEAVTRLKRLAANVAEVNDPADTLAERQRRGRLLASAASQQGLHDQAAQAYEDLLRLLPGSKEYDLLAAVEWRAAGDLDRAIGHFESATAGEGQIPTAWLGLAEARLDLQLRKPAGQTREWRAVDAALKEARRQLGETPPLVLLEGTAAIARNDRPAALETLTRLAAKDDLEPALLPRLATLLEVVGDSPAADSVIERYRAAGDAAIFAFTKSEILRRRGDVPAAILVLEEALDEIPAPRRDAIRHLIIGMEIDSGAMRSARNRLRELRKDKSAELWVYEMAADLALVAGDETDLKDCETELQALEGAASSLWRYVQALRGLAPPADPLDAVRQANRLLGEIEAARPGWPQALVLRGRIAERQGKFADAAEKYELALRSGVRNMATVQWLVGVLYRLDRYADAAAVIRQVGQMATLSGDFAAAAVPANLREGRVEDALRIARASAELRPHDPAAQIWFAQALALANKADEAEAVLKKTVELAPKDIRTWSGMIWFYSRLQRPDDARLALDSLVAKVELSPHDRELVLARGYDLIGDREAAEKHYLLALADDPKDVKLLVEMGRFYFKYDHDKALDAYQQALAVDPRLTAARRGAAQLLGLRGSEADLNQAVELLNRGDQTSASDDRRLQATMLLLRGGADNAQKVVDILTGLLEAKDEARPTDHVLLARAYEFLDRLDDAKAQFALALTDNDTPAFLVLYAEFLMRQKFFEEAGAVLDRLEEKAPGNPRGLELRVDWLMVSNRAGDIENTVDRGLAPRLKAATTDAQKGDVLRFAASLFARARLDEAVEKRLRETVALVPASYDSLAFWLADHNRLDEALALCLENAPGTDSGREASGVIRVLTIAATRLKDPLAQAPAAEKFLLATRASQPQNIQFLIEMGVLRVMQGRPEEALGFYEQALAAAPENPVIFNNLAVALADIPGRAAEALPHIEKALAAVPDSAEVLDSKALVLIALGRFAEAREILNRLCDIQKKNPQYRLHLAIALDHLGQSDEARQQIEQARADGLEKELLAPGERRFLQKNAGATPPIESP